MTPPSRDSRLIGHQRRFVEAVVQIDSELDFLSGEVVGARRDEVVAAARAAYGPSDDYRGAATPGMRSFPMASTAPKVWLR